MSSHAPVIANGDADEPNYEAVIIESKKAFPAEGGVLSAANIHCNPDWEDEKKEGFSSAGDFAVCIRYVAEGGIEPTYADMFYVGKRRPKQHVHARLVEPGWYSILPLAGKYSIFVINLSDRKVSAAVHVDGQRVGWTGLRPYSVSELSGFQMKPAESSENAVVDEKKFGTIEVFFREVAAIEKRIKEESSSSASQQPSQWQSQQASNGDEKVVPEHKKYHMTFQSVTTTPKYARQAPGTRVRQWKDGALVEDKALIGGCLRINYRTTLWAWDAKWLISSQTAEDENDNYNDGYDDGGEENDGSSLESSNRASQRRGRRGNKRQQADLPPSAAPNPKRRKPAEEDPHEDIVSALTRDSSIDDFFTALATINHRSPEDYKDAAHVLRDAEITNIDSMLQLTKQEWPAYLPTNLSPVAKRGLLTAITNLLQDVERKLGMIDLSVLN